MTKEISMVEQVAIALGVGKESPDDVPLHSMAHPGNPFDTMQARIAAIITGGFVDRESEATARHILEAIREPTLRIQTNFPKHQEAWRTVIDAALDGN